jgi:hypothetical protein
MRAGWVPFLLRGVWCPHIQRHRLYAFLKELSGPSFFSRHHRLSYPHFDDLFLRSLLKDSLAFTRPLFTRGRFRFVAKLPLGHYFWLRTLPLPGTHAGVDDRLGHEPGVVLPLPTQSMRFAHRTIPSKNITSCSGARRRPGQWRDDLQQHRSRAPASRTNERSRVCSR